MKKIVALVVIFLFTAGFLGCGSTTAETELALKDGRYIIEGSNE